MVICVAYDPSIGFLKAFHSETGFANLFIENKSNSEKEEPYFWLFEFIKSKITKESIDWFCVSLDFGYKNQFRKKFHEIAAQYNVKNIRMIGLQQKWLCVAIDELSISPEIDDQIWVFQCLKKAICCWIWEFDEQNGWKLQNSVSQQKKIDKSPTMEDFKNLKEKMKIGSEISFIYVNYGDHAVNDEEFKAVFSQFRKIVFRKLYHHSKWALNYARYLCGQQDFLNYKSESLSAYQLEIKKNDDTDVFDVYYSQRLPISKTATIDLKTEDKLKVLENLDLTSTIPIKEDGKYQLDLNIDLNGIFDFSLKFLGSEDDKCFAIPLKLNNYDPSLNAIGIDLGTTECCAAVIRKNGPEFFALNVIRNSPTMPSYIAFDEVIPKFGQTVVDRMRFNANYSVYDTKRILGKKIDEIIVDPLWPFKIVSSSESNVKIEVETKEGKKTKTCEEITAYFIAYIKTSLEVYQGEDLSEAVFTIPAKFSDTQKEATLEAAEAAEFTKVHFLPEPIAAAFAYCTELEIPDNSNILICDCGGGTVDICIAKINNQMLEISNFEEDSQLGGRDFDTILFNLFSAIVKQKFGIDVMKTKKKYLLKQKCQNIKHTLSDEDVDWFDVSDFDNELDEIIKISSDEFEEISAVLLLKIKRLIYRTVSNANLEKSQIDYVFEVGGGCRMPFIKEMLKDIFPDSNHQCHLYPNRVVAHGAALYAYHLKTKEQQ